MKRKLYIWLACCTVTPVALSAQDVRVRLYTNRPPATLSVRATKGTFDWRPCPTCGENVAQELKVDAGDAPGQEKEFYLTGRYELRPASGPPFLSTYPVHIEQANGRLLVTATMPLEDYVADVLTAESGGFENTESQKAMAVVARTYALRFMGQHAKDGFDFCDTTHCQAFGWKGASAAVRAAVAATRGETLRYDGHPAETYYHQNCGGMTAAAAEVWPGISARYLTSHADSYCSARGAMLWETTLRVDEIERALRASALATPTGWRAIEVAGRSESGRALRLRLAGGAGGNALVAASSFRFAVNRELGWDKIRSTAFDVRSAGGNVVFAGRGSGHGVGLCQVGAEEMAREGKSYREILSFYYPGTEIAAAEQASTKQAEQTAPSWQTRRSERVELVSTQPDSDATILPIAERVLREDEQAVGWQAIAGVQLRVSATLDAYRDTTGQPGWVAASTRGRTIRLQPLKILQSRGILEQTLRHEIFHVLVEARAKAATPLWFREGIVLCLSNPQTLTGEDFVLADEQVEATLRQPKNQDEVRKAYAAAQNRVAALMQQYGKEIVLGWLSSGIPGDVRGVASSGTVATHR